MRAHNSSLTNGLDMGRNLYRRWIYHGYYPCNASTISLIFSVGSYYDFKDGLTGAPSGP